MAGKRGSYQRAIVRALWAALLSLSILLPPAALPANASNDRTLYLYHTHTHKSGHFTFKRDGKYDPQVLKDLNLFLADWRTGQPTKMDPALFDLLWMVYQTVGASQPINIVSSYRTPATNAMLRSKSKAVAENSQHMKGKAMDFFIPGVPLPKLREVAMHYQVGGVGYYPTSGSPFVHLDTGSVRAWPRMTRAQLKKVFPDGRTLHLPTDGKPLSNDGRLYAQAEWNKCHMVPCKGEILTTPNLPETGSPDVMLAGLQAPIPAVRGQDLIPPSGGDLLDGMQVADVEPAHRLVETIAVSGPQAPFPAQKSRALAIATATIPPSDDGETALVALAHLGAPVPASRHKQDDEPLMVTAYVPNIVPEPGAQLALKMIIERETTGALPPTPMPKPIELESAPVQVASLGSESPINAFQAMLDATWDAVSSIGKPPVLANALSAKMAADPELAFASHEIELMPPDLEHVADTMVEQRLMSGIFYDGLGEPEGWLDKTTELGPLVTRMTVDPVGAIPAYDHFVVDAPLLVASR